MLSRYGIVLFCALLVGGFALGLPAQILELKPAAAEQKSDAKDEAKDKDEAEEDSSADNGDPDEKAKADDSAKKPDEDKKSAAEDDDKDEPKKDADKKPEKKRSTFTVKPKKLTVDFTIDTNFVADKMTEVILRPESWIDYEVKEAVPHGAEVHAGDVLVRFDSKRIDEAIADLELEQRLGELSLLRAEAELPRIEKLLEMTMADAEQQNERTLEDFDLYQKEERDLVLKLAKASLEQSEQNKQYEQDELDQLEKMYEADDLTEETEEIVLKRQRATVKLAETYHKVAQFNYDYQTRLSMPRQDMDIKEGVDRQKIAFERAKASLQLDLNKARYELEQERASRTKALEKHSKMLADRALMTIKAPADGLVYYGKCTNGQWNDLASMIEKLKPHGRVSGDTVIMTILTKRPLHLEGQIGESQLPHAAPGQSAVITPVGDEQSKKLKAKVETITPVPVSQGKFRIHLSLTDTELPGWIVPGLSGKAKITTYENKKALVVPKKGVRSEEEDEEKKYVWLVEDDEVEKRTVTTGKTKGDEIEITEGLEKDDVISLDDEGKKKKQE